MVSGEWQTKFNVSPGPGLGSLVLGPSGPDLGPGPGPELDNSFIKPMMDGSDKISDGEVKMNCNKTFLTLLKLQNSEIRILNISCMYFVLELQSVGTSPGLKVHLSTWNFCLC